MVLYSYLYFTVTFGLLFTHSNGIILLNEWKDRFYLDAVKPLVCYLHRYTISFLCIFNFFFTNNIILQIIKKFLLNLTFCHWDILSSHVSYFLIKINSNWIIKYLSVRLFIPKCSYLLSTSQSLLIWIPFLEPFLGSSLSFLKNFFSLFHVD